MNKFYGLSEAALRANINYANRIGDYQLGSLNLEVIVKPKADEFIKNYNMALAEIDNRHRNERNKNV